MILYEQISAENHYRIFYSTGIQSYVLAAVSELYEDFFRIDEVEYHYRSLTGFTLTGLLFLLLTCRFTLHAFFVHRIRNGIRQTSRNRQQKLF